MADAAREFLGDRFCDVETEHPEDILITVVDLTDADDAALHDTARRCGVEGRVRTRRADPAVLLAWEQLRQELRRLLTTRPGSLMIYPGPDSNYQRPPFGITLSAAAVDVAAALSERFGVFVELQVGALPYPPRSGQVGSHRLERPSNPTASPDELRVELDGPLIIVTGHTATHGLLLTNLTHTPITVATNGQLTARIADPATGAIVGGDVGVQRTPRISFTAAPSDTVRIPLLVGTASFDQDLGYAVPPGQWTVHTTLKLGGGRTLDTPPLPLVIRN